MGWTPQKLKQIIQFQEATEALLDELQQKGFKHKQIAYYNFLGEGKSVGASWSSLSDEKGVITLYAGCESGAVAHELAHGFHECLRRDFKIADKFGEAYAEAIRWFAEAKIGESDWSRGYKRQPRNVEILNACSWDWNIFVSNLVAHIFFPD